MTLPASAITHLAKLPRGATAVVDAVEYRGEDPIAARLEDLGFVPGEPLRVVGLGPVGGDPMVVQVGYTRFALRLSEAARIRVTVNADPGHSA